MSEEAETFPERLKSALGTRSVRGTAEAAGISEGSLRQYLAGKNDPGRVAIINLARTLGVDAGWLLTGETREEEGRYQVKQVFEPGKVPPDAHEMGVYALAGAGPAWDLSQYEPIETILVPNGFRGDTIVVVKVWGDSMAPVILKGAYVGVDREDKQLISGEIYAVWVPHEGAVVKRVFVGPDRLILRSQNPDFPEFSIPADEAGPEIVLGRVKWVLQKF